MARVAANLGMFALVVVMATMLRPYLTKHTSSVVWWLSFLIVLGLLRLPGWLFDRGQKPARPKIVKIHRSVPLPEGGTLFVSSKRIGPVDGFKGFRTTAIYDRQAEATGPRSAWAVIRYVGVLPVAVAAYLLMGELLAEEVNRLLLPISDITGYAVIFAGATLVAVLLGGLTAPRYRLRVTGGLTLLVIALQVCLVIRSAVHGTWDVSLWPVSLGQITAALIAVLLVWWGEHRLETRRHP